MSGQRDQSCPQKNDILHASCGFPQGYRKAWLGPRPSDCANAQRCLPLLHTGYRSGGLQDSDTDGECWSDTEVVPQPQTRPPREKPLSRSQSLRVSRKKPLVREVSGKEGTREMAALDVSPDLSWCACSLPQGTSRSLKVRTRKKTVPSDMDS